MHHSSPTSTPSPPTQRPNDPHLLPRLRLGQATTPQHTNDRMPMRMEHHQGDHHHAARTADTAETVIRNRRMNVYVGRDGKPISADEAMAAFADDDLRRVGRDDVNGHFVSTVWLVINHGHGDVPIPFETMIFSNHEGDCALDNYQERYATEDAARAGHDQACAIARDAKCGAA